MQDDEYYSGSRFYEESDVSNVNASFSDASDLPCPFADYASKRARRYGQWWTLTGVAHDCPNPANAQQRLQERYSQVVTLNHPNITRVVTMIKTPLFDDECVIEEYIDGLPLKEFLQSEPDSDKRRRLLGQVVDALKYCHSKGVVHGNLSLDTVMVTHQDHITKLTSFSCEGDMRADVQNLANVIDAFNLYSLKSIANRCRDGSISSIEDVCNAIEQHKSRKWIFPTFLLTVAALATVAIAFWAGYHAKLTQDSQLADSLPLPGIYFNDTVNLAYLLSDDSLSHYFSTITGADIFTIIAMDDIPGDISKDVALDLGLSVLWAPFNVGCANADVNHVGSLFTWCDTLGKGENISIDDFWPPNRHMTDITGTSYDSARRIWGNGWRMPTHDEWNELVMKCKWSLVKQRGIPMGYKVHGPSGAEIFLPMAGYHFRHRAHEIGGIGHYWSSTPVIGVDRQAYAIRLDSTQINENDSASLDYRFSIRPVLDKKK